MKLKGAFMSHTIADKEKLLVRVRKIKGQLGGIEKALEGEKECFKVLQQISATRGAMNALMNEVIEGHIKEHLGNHVSPTQRDEEIVKLITLLKTYLK